MGRVGRGLSVCFGVVVVLVLTIRVPAFATPGGTATIAVSDRSTGATIRPALTGVVWHDTGAPLTTLAPLSVRTVRIDASLQAISPARGVVNVQPLLDRISAVRAVGGDPLVILSYMPKWLGSCTLPFADATFCKPAALDDWGALIRQVVNAVATAPSGNATRFEVWNEPDLLVSWMDTPWSWLDVAARTGREIMGVERALGRRLSFGGPASFIPDPFNIGTFLLRMYAEGVRVDFVSWHWYANYPFFGPDGNEFPTLAPVYPLLGHRNPFLSPMGYGVQINAVRALVAAKAALAGQPVPALYIDEWNLSAGGFDNRNGTNEAAAFAAATLIEMQNAGLDEAMMYRATDKEANPGDWGMTTMAGAKKPVWGALKFWQELAGEQLDVRGSDPVGGVWAIASRDAGRVTVLVANFAPALSFDRAARVELPASMAKARATIRTIGPMDPVGVPRSVDAQGGGVTFDAPKQSVTFVEFAA